MSFVFDRDDYDYLSFENEVPKSFARFDACIPFNMSFPVSKKYMKTKKRKALVIMEYISTADLRNGQLLTKYHAKIFEKLCNLSQQWCRRLGEEPIEYEFAFVNFNYFKTYHLRKERTKDGKALYKAANAAAAKRVKKIIKRLEPDTLLILGDTAAEAILNKEKDVIYKKGVKLTTTIGGRELDVFTSLAYNSLYTVQHRNGGLFDDDEQEDVPAKELANKSNLLGFVARNLCSFWMGKTALDLSHVRPNYVYVDTMKKFRKMTKMLDRANRIGVDTETDSLRVNKNPIYVIQFAVSEKQGWVLPLYHPDTPFTPKQLQKIVEWLTDFFYQPVPEYTGKKSDRYLVFHGGAFDIIRIKRELKIPYIHWPIYDTLAGEYCLDENLQVLDSLGLGKYRPFNLKNTLARYGCHFYFDSGFRKEDRNKIRETPLDQDFLSYCSMDVQSIIALAKRQMRWAKVLDWYGDTYYKTFKRLLLVQLSNTIHGQADMKARGTHIDKQYLMTLRSNDSSIVKLQKELDEKFLRLKSVKRANQILLKNKGRPTKGFFGSTEKMIFNLRDNKHKQLLFFDVLGLEPVSRGKSGAPSLDKKFQEKYRSSQPSVEIMARKQQLNTLFNTFVKGLFRISSEDPDCVEDDRIHPSYSFQSTVTGRSNSFDPNLQQIPEQKKEAKLIKRIFTTREGEVYIKYDYGQHEVRCWGIISLDKALCGVFNGMLKLTRAFRFNPTEKNRTKLEMEGDFHRLSYKTFTGTPIKEITNEQRQASKVITFGNIYGRAPSSLANQLGVEKEKALELIKQMFKRYRKGKKWLDNIVKFASKNYYAPSPLGRRRNLWGYIAAEHNTRIKSALNRRAMNSPIQGMASDIAYNAARLISLAYEKLRGRGLREGDLEPMGIENMVHDALYNTTKIEQVLPVLYLIMYWSTTGLSKWLKRQFDFPMLVNFSIDLAFGTQQDKMYEWDFSEDNLRTCLRKSIKDQVKLYHPEYSKKKVKRLTKKRLEAAYANPEVEAYRKLYREALKPF